MKTLESFDFGRSSDRGTYDWDVILNGNINVLEKGSDFTCKPQTLKMRARQVAKKKGLRVQTSNDKDGNIVIRAYKPEPGTETTPPRPRKQRSK